MFPASVFLLAFVSLPRFSAPMDWTDKGADLFVVVDERGTKLCQADTTTGTDLLCDVIKDIFQLRQYTFTIQLASAYERKVIANSSDTDPDQAYKLCNDVFKPRINNTIYDDDDSVKREAQKQNDSFYKFHDRSIHIKPIIAIKTTSSPSPDVVIWIDYVDIHSNQEKEAPVTRGAVNAGADVALGLCGFHRNPKNATNTMAWLRSQKDDNKQFDLKYSDVSEQLLQTLDELLSRCPDKNYKLYEHKTQCYFNSDGRCGYYYFYIPPTGERYCWVGNSSWINCTSVKDCNDICRSEAELDFVPCNASCNGEGFLISRPNKSTWDPFYEHCPWNITKCFGDPCNGGQRPAVSPKATASGEIASSLPAQKTTPNTSLPVWQIAVIGGGVFLLLVAVTIAVVCCVKKKQKGGRSLAYRRRMPRGRRPMRRDDRNMSGRGSTRRHDTTQRRSMVQSNVSAAQSIQRSEMSAAPSFSRGPRQPSRSERPMPTRKPASHGHGHRRAPAPAGRRRR